MAQLHHHPEPATAAQQPVDHVLEHRRQVRGLLAVIRAIVHRTAHSALTVEDYAAHLSGRLDALVRVQEILMRDAGAPVDLAELLADEFLAQGIAPRSVATTTPSLMVDPPAAAALAMALHELATNAIKFGQLDHPARQICISWNTEDENWTRLVWCEQPLESLPSAPLRSGFGFELIRHTLPYEIGARTRIEMTDRGLFCEIFFCPRSAVVEDNYFLATELAGVLKGNGAIVLGPVTNMDGQRRLASDLAPDCALLDIDLTRERPFGLAELLHDRGVPTIFTTAYDCDVIPRHLRQSPCLRKPLDYPAVLECIRDSLRQRLHS